MMRVNICYRKRILLHHVLVTWQSGRCCIRKHSARDKQETIIPQKYKFYFIVKALVVREESRYNEEYERSTRGIVYVFQKKTDYTK